MGPFPFDVQFRDSSAYVVHDDGGMREATGAEVTLWQECERLVERLETLEGLQMAIRDYLEVKHMTIPQLRERFGDDWTREVGHRSGRLSVLAAPNTDAERES